MAVLASVAVRAFVVSQINRNVIEDGLVQTALHLVWCFFVQHVSFTEQSQQQLETTLEKCHVLLAGLDEPFRIGNLGQDSSLAFLHVVFGDGVIEEGIEQFLFLTGELIESVSLRGQKDFASSLHFIKALLALNANGLNHFRLEVVARPALFDCFLGDLHWQIRQIAVRSAGVPSEAEEVGVNTALATA